MIRQGAPSEDRTVHGACVRIVMMGRWGKMARNGNTPTTLIALQYISHHCGRGSLLMLLMHKSLLSVQSLIVSLIV